MFDTRRDSIDTSACAGQFRPPPRIGIPISTHPKVELVSFTGSVEIGKLIATTAGYKKLCLELGGNSPLIIFDDADLDLAVQLAAEGCFRNSGQRCTAVKRILVQRGILDAFTERFVEKAKEYITGDPADPDTRVGTVIDAAAAELLEARVQQAVADGARLLRGGSRTGAAMQPTVVDNVPRGTTNINDVPGYRIESSPFGGIKDSGLGIKEGVIESIKFMTNTKTFSIPW